MLGKISKLRLTLIVSVMPFALGGGIDPAFSATCAWLGSTGAYNNGAFWDCGVQPGSGDDAVITTANSVVTITGYSASAGTVDLGVGNQFNMTSATLTIYNNSVTNNGAMVLNNSSLNSGSGNLVIGGTGTITLTASYLFNNGAIDTIGAGQTVNGSGGSDIGLNNALLINNGTIASNVSGGTLYVDPAGGNGGVGGSGLGVTGAAGMVNTGVMTANNASTLVLYSGQYDNSGGTISATNSSQVVIADNVRIIGGSLTSDASSALTMNSGTQYLQNTTLTSGSTLNIGNDAVAINTAITNNGTIDLDNGSLNAETSSAAINGNGTIALTGGSYMFNNGGVDTIGAGQTIYGSGASDIGLNGSVIVNNGVIDANVSGQTLYIDPAGGNGGVGTGNGVGTGTASGFLNSGVLEATNGATLQLLSGLYENGSGHGMSASGGSTLVISDNVRILNGTLTSDATSSIVASGATQELQNVTLASGSLLTMTNDLVQLNTAFVNNGTINLVDASLNSEAGQPMTISGTGTINLSQNSLLFNNGGIDTLGSNQTVTGTASNIGANNAVIINDGNLSISGSSSLTLDVAGGNGGVGAGNGAGTNGNAGFLNSGTVSVTGGSSLLIESGLYENATGHAITATDGSTIDLNDNVRILNGTLSSDGTSSFIASGATQELQNVTLASGSLLTMTNDLVQLNTAFVNNGTINLVDASLNSEAGQPMTISGTGTINLSQNSLLFNNGGIDTLGSNQTVTGTASNIGANNAVIINDGNLSISGGSSLTLDVAGGNGGVGAGNGAGTNGNAGFLNSGTVSVTGGSSLLIDSGLYENATGHAITATLGSTIDLNDNVRVLNGTLSSDGTSSFVANSGTQYLQNVTLAGGTTFGITSDTVLLNTSLVNGGTINLSASSLNSEIATLAISGTGTINLANGSLMFNDGGTDTIGAGQTVNGSGGSDIGYNSSVIVNQGSIVSNVSGSTLYVDPAGGNGGVGSGLGVTGDAGMLNTGLIAADNSSTLVLNSGQYDNTGGTISATNASQVVIGDNVRIIGGSLTSDSTSAIVANSGTEFLQNTTLTTGSALNIGGASVLLNTADTNNGTITLNSASLNAETATVSINGTGTIDLTNGSYMFNNGGIDTVGGGQTVNGSGNSNIGLNSAVIVNNGFIGANVSGETFNVDPAGGNGGLSGNGVGTNDNSGLLNNGVLQALNGSTLVLNSGLYENGGTGLGGEIYADTGSTVVMNNDTSLQNLQAGGVLSGGRLYANSDGAAATINLQSNAANTITTIGTASGPATEVILQGANSVIEVTPFGGGTPTTIDQTLGAVEASGTFALDNRDFTVVANAGNFSNSGLVFVNNSALSASSINNIGSITADNTASISGTISNYGTVLVSSGTLTSAPIVGPNGTIQTNAGATLNLGGVQIPVSNPGLTQTLGFLGGPSSAGLLVNNGTLELGSNNITVTSDYQNASFGSGNAFSGTAHVTGSGLILAASATMDLSDSGALTGTTLNVGSVRTGGSSSTELTITNNGTLTTLRGAVQNGNASSVELTDPDFVIGPNGGSTNVTISYTGTQAGSLAGQSINVVNNFANVAGQTINLEGNVYQAAEAGTQPATITLAASRVGGPASTAAITIANTAPVTPGFNDALGAALSTSGGFLVAGGATTSVNVAAGDSTPVALSLGTGTAGSFSNAVMITNTDLAVAGSGLTNVALGSQVVTVAGNVYAVAQASLPSATVNFGVVRQGAADPTGALSVTNTATGNLVDQLLTTVSGLPPYVTGSAPAALAAGASGNASFQLSTVTAGVIDGTGSLGFASHDGQLSDVSLGSQTVNFTGTVTQVAQAVIDQTGGTGSLSGSGIAYTLALGDLAANSGSVNADLGVLNTILSSAYSEALGGSFTLTAADGYSFSGADFSGIAGGNTDTGNVLDFDTTGLADGTYDTVLTLNANSEFSGLSDLALAPIQIDITANITGGTITTGAVPEPGTWGMMLVGLGMAGAAMRRRARLVKLVA